jgi:two-component system response regulator
MEKRPDADLLLIEDSPDHVELASRVFQQLGAELKVHIVQDGQEALNFIFGRGPYQGQGYAALKLVILDLYLPKISGIDVLRELRADPSTRPLPVAILTITGNERGQLEKSPFNVQHYIRKPLELNDFLKLYSTYIDKKKPI